MSTNATETLQFNCTTCPSECLLTVEVERDANGAVVEVRSVTGNNCPRGDKFAHQELTCPMRVLTTTVAASGGDEALLPVRTAEAIPLALHAQAMDLIRGLVVNAPIRQQAHDEHLALIGLCRARDAAGAEVALQRHIAQAASQILSIVERLLGAPAHEPSQAQGAARGAR